MSRGAWLVLLKIFLTYVSIFILIGVAGLLAAGFLLLLMGNISSSGINEEDRVIKHFKQNQAALELVVQEVLDTDATHVRQTSWLASQRPGKKALRPLQHAMRRAKVLRVWVRGETQSDITLIVGTRAHMIDTEFFGYLWTPNPENVVEGQGVHEGKYLRLSPNWFLYRFEES